MKGLPIPLKVKIGQLTNLITTMYIQTFFKNLVISCYWIGNIWLRTKQPRLTKLVFQVKTKIMQLICLGKSINHPQGFRNKLVLKTYPHVWSYICDLERSQDVRARWAGLSGFHLFLPLDVSVSLLSVPLPVHVPEISFHMDIVGITVSTTPFSTVKLLYCKSNIYIHRLK